LALAYVSSQVKAGTTLPCSKSNSIVHRGRLCVLCNQRKENSTCPCRVRPPTATVSIQRRGWIVIAVKAGPRLQNVDAGSPRVPLLRLGNERVAELKNIFAALANS